MILAVVLATIGLAALRFGVVTGSGLAAVDPPVHHGHIGPRAPWPA